MSEPGVTLPKEALDALRALDTCAASNAIETFNVRLRNEGFALGTAHCQFKDLEPMLGYAVTAHVRSSAPPIRGGWYYDRMDFWSHVLSVPAPRVLVFEDLDDHPGTGALVGEVHAQIGLALGCVGCVTNGAVRDLPAVEKTGFHLFAGSVSLSHAYAHVVEFGKPVEIGGLKIGSGELVHGDCHGVQTVPLEIAREIPRVASELLAREREIIAICKSPGFSLEKLGERFRMA